MSRITQEEVTKRLNSAKRSISIAGSLTLIFFILLIAEVIGHVYYPALEGAPQWFTNLIVARIIVSAACLWFGIRYIMKCCSLIIDVLEERD
jgi:hypothetical protein